MLISSLVIYWVRYRMCCKQGRTRFLDRRKIRASRDFTASRPNLHFSTYFRVRILLLPFRSLGLSCGSWWYWRLDWILVDQLSHMKVTFFKYLTWELRTNRLGRKIVGRNVGAQISVGSQTLSIWEHWSTCSYNTVDDSPEHYETELNLFVNNKLINISVFRNATWWVIINVKNAFPKFVDIYLHVHCPKNKADFRENKGGSPLEGKFSSNPWKWWLLS